MNKKYGVIDLGTNTFHLLIVSRGEKGQLEIEHRHRIFVHLAEEGIEKIGAAAFQRGLSALKTFRDVLDKRQVSQIKAIGTAALRTASNSPLFIEQVAQQLQIKIQLISGAEEARLIHRGTTLAVQLQDEKGLIMDIGGGSIEFIIANQQGVLWAQSFPIGLAVLYKKFHKSDPISPEEINQLKTFLNHSLAPLFIQLEQHETPVLIGASGTFDVLELMLSKEKISKQHSIVEIEDFLPLYDRFLPTTVAERRTLEAVPATRAEMIIVALVLIQQIVEQASIQRISVSAYAMKEGILYEMMQD